MEDCLKQFLAIRMLVHKAVAKTVSGVCGVHGMRVRSVVDRGSDIEGFSKCPTTVVRYVILVMHKKLNLVQQIVKRIFTVPGHPGQSQKNVQVAVPRL